MKLSVLSIPTVSIAEDSSMEIANAIRGSEHGVLTVSGFPAAPFEEILSTFDRLSDSKDFTDRLNDAYPKNLVYKDAHANGKGGPTIDLKRVLDLSPERLEEMKRNDPALMEAVEKEGALDSTLAYWEKLRLELAPKIVDAVGHAIGHPTVVKDDAAFNYRMVDYYHDHDEPNTTTTNNKNNPPRCGEHRDFGSFTLVFPSHGGLQVFVNNQWMDLEVPSSGSAILLFGWCTQIRSNGRIPAVLHRVTPSTTDHSGAGGGAGCRTPRRVSAVLFCAPKRSETPLEPTLLLEGEQPKYVSGIRAGQLRGSMARKWQLREGTIKPEDLIIEEAEILSTNMRTQDDVVRQQIMTTTATA